ncbi:MAG: Fic family protein [Verrucomicrobiae bacterium]|nr:Fic family protein [Verrucomicrobiae bacterium]
MPHVPPVELTQRQVDLISKISERLGAWSERHGGNLSPQLRRENRIRTIQASLAIEANTLSFEQVSDLMDGKPVAGPPREITEVKNAIRAYENLENWHPWRVEDFLEAHRLLMDTLREDAGSFRAGGVGIYQGERLVHMVPLADRVPHQVADLLGWLRDTDTNPLLAGAIAHYEIEFIHPFSDGNGRIGRLWQTLVLSKWKPELAWLPIETVVHHRQNDYYAALAASDKAAEAGPFAEFILEALWERLGSTDQVADQVTDQVKALLALMGEGDSLSMKELMKRAGLRHRPTFRANYLTPAIETGLIEMTDPESPRSPRQKYRRKRDSERP